MVRLTDRPDMTIAVYCGGEATTQCNFANITRRYQKRNVFYQNLRVLNASDHSPKLNLITFLIMK